MRTSFDVQVAAQLEWGLMAGRATKLELLNVESGREPWPGAAALYTARRTLDAYDVSVLRRQLMFKFGMVARLELIRRMELEA